MSDGFFVRRGPQPLPSLLGQEVQFRLGASMVPCVRRRDYRVPDLAAAKQDEGRYVEVDEYGAIKATRQIRHVLYDHTATGLELSRTEEENGKRRSAENRIKRQDLLTRQDAIGTVAAHS